MRRCLKAGGEAEPAGAERAGLRVTSAARLHVWGAGEVHRGWNWAVLPAGPTRCGKGEGLGGTPKALLA